MNRKIETLLCSGAALLTFAMPGVSAASPAVPRPAPPPQSYAELLDPIPDAAALLKADDALRRQETPRLERVQDHHHHHHHFPRYHHHHHHNAFFGFGDGDEGWGGYYAPTACYWTWSRPFWNGYRWVRRRVRVCR